MFITALLSEVNVIPDDKGVILMITDMYVTKRGPHGSL